MTGFAIVTTTVGSKEAADTLARMLIEGRFAACVQIVPATSHFRWNGAVEEAAEYLLLCKIAAERFAEVEAAIRQSHGYDLPEIVMTGIVAGSAPYLAWLASNLDR